MLKLGTSKPWPDAMEAITGQRLMTADAINAYFAPLKTWLEETNEKNGETIGWETQGKLSVNPFNFQDVTMFYALHSLVRRICFYFASHSRTKISSQTWASVLLSC